MNDVSDAELIELDREGFFPVEGETPAGFIDRVGKIKAALATLDSTLENSGKASHLDCLLLKSDRIDKKIIFEADAITEKLFDFRHHAVPGFFQSTNVGFLWGGCAIYSPDDPPALFFLRSSFAKQTKWWVYRRDELLAHELCHVARQSVNDPAMEEFFAYRTSFSCFRRWCGDLFTHWLESVLFLIFAIALPTAQALKGFVYPGFPAWQVFGAFGCFLLILICRTWYRHHIVAKAVEKLDDFGVAKPLAVLFRLTKNEIRSVSGLKDQNAWMSFLARRSENSLRWKIIALRFVSANAKC